MEDQFEKTTIEALGDKWLAKPSGLGPTPSPERVVIESLSLSEVVFIKCRTHYENRGKGGTFCAIARMIQAAQRKTGHKYATRHGIKEGHVAVARLS